MPNIDNENLLTVIRTSHWYQAKGHLEALLNTFWPDYGTPDDESQYACFYRAYKKFIDEIEYSDLHR